MENNKLVNWIPYKLIKADNQLKCNWLDTYGQPFTEPFFDETILKLKSMDARRSVFSSVSDLMMMKEWAKDLSEVEPTALIFHVSRCGSTLISQMLATADENVVLAEVPFFDDILRLPYKYHDFDQVTVNELLLTAIKFYGQKKTGSMEKRLFIKTDSWHLFFHEQLRQIYPSVPFIFIYRDPGGVFRSHSKLRGMQAVPGLIEPQLFGFKPGDMAYQGLDIYLSKMLESYFNQCIKIANAGGRSLFLNYNEGPMPMIEKIAAFTNMKLSRQDLLKMNERSLYHSKKPGEYFSEEEVTNIPACLDKAMKLYRELEKKNGYLV